MKISPWIASAGNDHDSEVEVGNQKTIDTITAAITVALYKGMLHHEDGRLDRTALLANKPH
ncbi:hypothetical protein [Sodalis-like endosymbiont of Proechinophthirus fluctus]|uniref:hypothetical protein n=1 Tax=Sodalis-like endosymbiont of Proechinophthirus fluctus TaxID=1462730 RepID=UPI00164FB4F3|nr:hypothetical protein [Sodalis-like endosymbiont of Proechinophthirus fluctus]